MRATHSTAPTIEHRVKERKPVKIDVVIYRNRIPVAVGKARDICGDGMGIESDIANIKLYSLLEVEVRVNSPSNTAYHRLKGLVVHQEHNSFGLAFTELNPTKLDMLNQLMVQR